MKKLMAAVLAVVLLSPAVAFAGSAATNAALGLGAFAVFNQILGGVGIFGGPRPVYAAPAPVYAPAPVVYAPPPAVYAPPPVVYAPPTAVYAAPPVVYAPPTAVYAPSTVVYGPPVVVRRPVVVRPHHGYPVYGHRPVVYQRW